MEMEIALEKLAKGLETMELIREPEKGPFSAGAIPKNLSVKIKKKQC